MSRRHHPRERELFESGYVQEWIWSYSHAKRLVRYVFLAIGRWARRTRSGEYETRPLSVDDLKEATDLGESTIYKAIEELAGPLGEIDVLGQPGAVRRFRLRRQLSLLMDVDEPTRHRYRVPDPPVLGTGDPSTAYGGDLYAVQGSPVRGTGVAGDVSSFSEVVRNEVPTSTAEERAAAEAFLAWMVAEHPKHRGEARMRRRATDVETVCALLRTWPGDQLRAMAVVMWTVRESEDGWLATKPTERGVKLLNHAAPRFDELARARARQVEAAAPRSVVDAGQQRRQAVERALARLAECPDGSPLRDAYVAAAARLRAEDCDVVAVDAALVAAARGVVDLGALELEARRELDGMRARLGSDAFESLLGRQIDQLVRAHAALPDLLSIAALDERIEAAG